MNETVDHFIAVCPGCSVHLRINRKYRGVRVSCNHCSRAFVAEPAQSSVRSSSDEYVVGPFPTPEPTNRVITVCPGCQATLSIRRIYLGRRVVCKKCNHRFPVRDNAASAELPARGEQRSVVPQGLKPSGFRFLGGVASASVLDPLMAQNEKLFADFQRVKAESARHAANYSRYKTKYRQAIDQLGDVTRRLEEIQLRQGNFDSGDEMSLTEDADRPRQSDAPGNSRGSRLLEADTIAIAAERANLVREAARMADCLEAAQAERDRMALADKERVAEIAARKNEIENLRQDLQGARARVNELNARGDELEAAANRENAKLAAEIESLRQQLAELASDRDVVQAEKDGLREYIAALRVSLDRLEERHRSEFDRLMSEHEELREQYQRLTAEKAGLDRACRQNQERYDELLRAYRALEARHHSSQSHTPSPSSSSSSSVTYSSDAAHVAVELKAARSQIQALTDKVEVLERNKRRLEVLVTALGIELK